jgi:hypothetical protein
MHSRGGFDGGEVNDSQLDLYSQNELCSPGAARTGYYDGRLNSQADWQGGLTPRVHKQDSASTSHRGSNHHDSFSYTQGPNMRRGFGIPSDRSHINLRSSAEQQEIDKLVNRGRKQNMVPSVSSSQDKHETFKLTLEKLINDIAKKEKTLNDEKTK